MIRLTSKQLALQSGINVESIRFYEKERLLPRPPRTAAGYRIFSPDDVRRVRFIKRAQELGFSLRQIRELLALRGESGAGCGEVRQQVQEKIGDIDQKIADLRRMRKTLARLAAACPGRGATRDCPILESLDRTSPLPPPKA